MTVDKRIVPLLKKHPGGLTMTGLVEILHLGRREKVKLVEDLKRLERDGLIRRARRHFVLPPRTGVVRGVLAVPRRGFGFVTPADGGDDVFVPARFAGEALHGDEVELFVREGREGRNEGRVVRILRRGETKVLGAYRERDGRPYLLAFDSPSSEEMLLRSRGAFRPEPDMVVEADRKTLTLTAVLGRADDPGVDTCVVIRRHGLRTEFPPETLREAGAAPAVITAADLEGRRDYRDWPAMTIDGESAQDFDDAVSIRRLDGGRVLLGVHIADVSHYVRPGTALDEEACRRATSVYFPGLTLPMLPEALSNDLCSLRPRVDRLTVSAVMEIDGEGGIAAASFHPSVIRTAERMTYSAVAAILDGDAAARARFAPLVADFLLMRDLSRRIRARRTAEGGLDFDLAEPELVYREGALAGVAAAERNEAHLLIEDFMVTANVAVALFLERRRVPSLYRVHPAPAVGDLAKLRELLLPSGLVLPEADRIKSKDLQRILEAVRGRPEEKFVGVEVLRAMKMAAYADENLGHYGLARPTYTHFTSPIRRYPDLVVHRQLKSVLLGDPPEPRPLAETARHASLEERRADEAERDLVTWRIFRLLKARLGDEFSGTVTGVNRAGLVVELDDYFVDGLLSFQALDDARGERRPRRRRDRSDIRRLEPGDRVRVVLAACDPFLRRMAFVPAGAAGDGE